MFSREDVRQVKHLIGTNPVRLIMENGESWEMDGQFGRHQSSDGTTEVYYPNTLIPLLPKLMNERGWE